MGKFKFKRSGPLWSSYRCMHSRCYNKNNKDYYRYGGRGIIVSKKWHNFDQFVIDMGIRPKNKTLDRINNNKNYNKSNCRWATNTEQQSNKENNIYITHRNKRMTATMWARELKISKATFFTRLNSGWDIEKIIKTKPDKRMNKRYNLNYLGEKYSLSSLCKKLGVVPKTIKRRVRLGLPLTNSIGAD